MSAQHPKWGPTEHFWRCVTSPLTMSDKMRDRHRRLKRYTRALRFYSSTSLTAWQRKTVRFALQDTRL